MISICINVYCIVIKVNIYSLLIERNMSLGIETLRDKIRYGEEPDNPALIPLWFSIEESEQSTINPAFFLRSKYESQFYLLLEAVVDELIPAHWRRVCLDNIYKPLSSLQRLARDDDSKKRLSKLLHELSTSCRYVEQSL